MNRTIHIFIKLFFLYSVSLCQWSTDQSTPQSFGSGIQAQVASTADGGLYIAWLSDGNYHVYLQYLNHLGEAQLGDGGMVISDNQNASWIAVYHLNLSVDHEGNAIISTLDQRTGSVWEVYVYKIGSDGNMYWGESGLALTSSSISNMSPRLAINADNSVTVTWTHNDNSVLFQSISSNGTILWDDGILIIDNNATLISPNPVISSDNNILIQWIRQTGPFWAANSELYLQKYDYNGNNLWSEPIIAAGPVVFPMGNWAQQSLTNNIGSFSAWTEMSGNVQNAKVQHIDTDGNLLWASGVNLSDNNSHFRISPKLTITENNDNLFAVWNESNSSQSQRGIFAQRLDSEGNKLWGPNGIGVVELNGDYDYLDLSISYIEDDMISSYIEQSIDMNGDIYAARLDQNGDYVWTNSRVAITSSGSSKSDMVTAAGPNCVYFIWTESGSVYGHCLRSDGTLGPPDITPPGVINDQEIEEDEILNIDLSEITETVIYGADSDTTAVSVSIENQNLLLIPLPNWHGNSIITVYMIDENNILDTNSFTLTVTPVNDSPTIEEIDDISIDEDGSISIVLISDDVDGDDLIYSFHLDNYDLGLGIEGDILNIIATPDFNGDVLVKMFVSDFLLSDSTSFIVTVNAVNDIPMDFSLVSPTILDTIQINSDTDETVPFIWGSSFDVDSEVIYKLIVTLNHFGTAYDNYYDNITDTTIGISTYEYATLMSNLGLSYSNINYFVESSDEEFTIVSEQGGFVFQNTSLSIDSDIVPKVFALHQNYPNPFNPKTNIRYELAEDTFISLNIYDIKGNVVKSFINKVQKAGYKMINWNSTNNLGENVSAGMYIYTIQAGDFIETKKMILLK